MNRVLKYRVISICGYVFCFYGIYVWVSSYSKSGKLIICVTSQFAIVAYYIIWRRIKLKSLQFKKFFLRISSLPDCYFADVVFPDFF